MTKKRKQQAKKITKSNNKIEINKNNKNIILISFILSRLILIVFLLINKDFSIFEIFDSVHYLNIAEFGYSHPQLYAFFPLYPSLIKLLSVIIPSYKLAGALISNVSAFASLIILNELTKEKNNHFNIICFIFSPILAFTSIVYTESLFMLLTLFGYYLYKKDKYILSAIVVGLSILTRNSGIILWGSIGLEMLYRFFSQKEKPIKFNNIITFGIISLLIGLIYPIYLYIKTGNFLEFAAVQNEHWGRVNGTFIGAIINDIKVIIRDPQNQMMNLILFLQNWISFFLTFILGIKIFKKDKVASIYTIVSLLAFTCSYRDITVWLTLSSISLFRYVLNLFPIYLYMSNNKNMYLNVSLYTFYVLISICNTIVVYSDGFIY